MNTLIFDQLDAWCDVDVSMSRWHRTESRGKQGHKNYSSVQFLPRISRARAQRIINDVCNDLQSTPKRDRLIDLVKAGLGVPPSVELLKTLRLMLAGSTEEQRTALTSALAEVEASIEMTASFMSPWPYIPAGDWVSSALGREVWPFFKSNAVGVQHTTQVPEFGAYGAMVYRQSTYESTEYTLCDAYVFKYRKGVNAIPAMFALRSDLRKRSLRGMPTKIDVKGILSGTGMYFTLFGVFHFTDATLKQSAYLSQLLKLDTLKATELWDMYPTAKYTALRESLHEARTKAATASAFIEKHRKSLERGTAPPALEAKAQRAEAKLQRVSAIEAEISDLEKSLHPDSALSRVAFYALDVMLPTNITRPSESEWRPIKKSAQFLELAQRLAPSSETVKGKKITYTLRPKGSRIW